MLLEQRIVDSATRVLRSAAEEAQNRADQRMRDRMSDLEDRLARLWASEATTAEEAARREELTRRLTDDFTRRVVDETTEEYGR